MEPRRRPSRADRAHAKQEEDRARREAAAEGGGGRRVSHREPRQPDGTAAGLCAPCAATAGRTGHFEIRELTRMGVELAGIWWCPPGEPPIKVAEMVPERLPLLAEALAEYLAGEAP